MKRKYNRKNQLSKTKKGGMRCTRKQGTNINQLNINQLNIIVLLIPEEKISANTADADAYAKE